MFDLVRFLKGLAVTSETDPTKQLSVQISPSATTGTSTTVVAAQTSNQTLNLPDITGTLSTSALTETLTNKTIDGDDNTVQDLALASLKTNLSDASKFVVRDASGIVVSNSKAVPAGVVVGTTDAQTLTNKSIDASTNTITNIVNANVSASAAIAVSKLAAQTASRAVATDGSGILTPSTTTSTELGFVSGVTSAIQTQLNTKPTTTGSFTDNHVVRADGTANVQTSNVVIDDSGNITGANSFAITGGNGISISQNAIQSNNNTALNISTNSTSQQVYIDRNLTLGSPAGGVPGQLSIREDLTNGGNVVNIQPVASLTADRTFTLPDITMTALGADSTQNMSNKTFTDAITLTQIATPSTPSATHNKFYVKSDNKLYTLNSSGVEVGVSTGSVVSKTANYTASLSDDIILCNTATAGFTVTLPTATGNSGKSYIIKTTNIGSTGALNISTTGGQFIESGSGNTSIQLLGRYDEITLVSDGTAWNIVSRYFPQYTDGSSNPTFISTQPSASNVWANVVGNNFGISPGVWELNACLFYTNNGTSAGYSNHYGYWCAATGTNTTTAPAALSTIAGLTVIGGYTPPYIADTQASDVMVNLPTLVVNSTVFATIFVGMRATCTTSTNARFIPVITAKRIG